ncbi:diacylglycerol kinase [Helcococcus bovis]|uniref:diacylglycerol kinase n=1 Tax=Helcococcus bovis TaxID=3153252 RepID=UPI0038BC89C8
MKNYDTEERDKIKNNNKIASSFDNAINGIIESVNTERNMKIHIVIATMVLILSFLLDFTRVELIIIAITTMLVLVTELINTAIETLTDLTIDGKYHELAKKTKDISAGAVLLMSVNSLIVGYLLLYPKLKTIFISKNVFQRIMINQEHLVVISIGVVMLLTLLLKGIFFKKNTTHLFGGSVSGHTSLAFNIATIGYIISKNYIIGILLFLLALIVGESRYEAKIHTLKEIIIGAILGILLAVIIFINYI